VFSFAIGLEVAIWLAGLALLGLILLGRIRLPAPALPAWLVSIEGFVTGVIFVLSGAFLLPHAVAYLSNDLLGPAARDGDWWFIVQSAAFQLGLLGGAVAAWLYLRRRPARPHLLGELAPDALAANAAPLGTPTSRPLRAGGAVFLLAIPLISTLGLGWKLILDLCGLATDEQDMVGMFRDLDDPARLWFMLVLAVVVAPVTEELVFRAGLFRYLRTRIPRHLALALPAVVFALLHGNIAAFLPLCALGVFFAIAYEQTGRIAVPMIAHALFNLHTILLIMAGVTS